jgi:hypothetical protein
MLGIILVFIPDHIDIMFGHKKISIFTTSYLIKLTCCLSKNGTQHDLSSLPSIMTRTSRLGQQNNHIFANHSNVRNTILNTQSQVDSNGVVASAAALKASLTSSQAILNHTLTVKTTGFADLAFIDFSCINFPRIAQNYCELWPRRLLGGMVHGEQPLHNYRCTDCGFCFPCKSSLHLHKMKKVFGSSRLDISSFATERYLFLYFLGFYY